MKQFIMRTFLSLFILTYTLTGVAQTEVISEKYELEKSCLNKKDVKNNRYYYHYISEFSKLKNLEYSNKIKQKSVDYSVFINKGDEKKYHDEVLSIVNKVLSLRETKLLQEEQCNLFFTMYIDESYNIFMVEISCNKELEKILNVRKITKIINKIKKEKIKGIISIPERNYIKLTVVRKYNE